MLAKMGWSKGKGLGAKEDGIVEHVKISYKNDSKGMGFKENNDQWTEHDMNFNALLESLSGGKAPSFDKPQSSLEQKSLSSKVRVHYKKFTRGKDLSRYSEKDLANIFGKKSLKQAAKREEGDSSEDKKGEIKDSFTHNGGSMVDYFKRKLPNFGKSNGYVVGSNGVLKRESDSEEERVGFGFETTRLDNEESRKMKKDEQNGFSNPAFDPMFRNLNLQKHVLNTIEEEENDDKDVNGSRKDVDTQMVENGDSNEAKKKKKKKRRNESGVDNLNFEENQNVEEEKLETPSRKNKKKKGEATAVDNPIFDENAEENHSSFVNGDFEVKRKKKKEKSSASQAMDNPTFDLTAEEDSQTMSINDTFEVKRKKKKDKSSVVQAIDNPTFDITAEEDSQTVSINDTFEVKRNKKRKIEETSSGIDNPSFGGSSADCHQNDRFEVKRKKMKSDDGDNSSMAIDNPNFDISSTDCQNNFVDANFEVKRKKKKKKDFGAVSNPNFQDSMEESTKEIEESKKEESEEPSFDLMLNVTSTPSVAVEKKKKGALPKRRKSVRFSNVNEERIIPNNEDIENRNDLFDINSRVIEDGLKDSRTNEDLDAFSRQIDQFQAEIENDINEAKITRYIGEVGNPDGENEKLPDGTRLKFKNVIFRKSPHYLNRSTTRAKASYKHLIKGDIIVKFSNTNLHEIVGYGVKNKNS